MTVVGLRSSVGVRDHSSCTDFHQQIDHYTASDHRPVISNRTYKSSTPGFIHHLGHRRRQGAPAQHDPGQWQVNSDRDLYVRYKSYQSALLCVVLYVNVWRL